ncbi:MAG: peptidase M1 [Flavobacteriaceae bacterium]|nr:peptidase M1 [Flavobacteriaceae bacterium]
MHCISITPLGQTCGAILAILLFTTTVAAQTYTRQDTLRGSITPERAWWDVQHYDLSVTVNPDTKPISGVNILTYKVLQEENVLQIDLQPPMKLEEVVQEGEALRVTSEGNAHFIHLKQEQQPGKDYELTLHFSGMPRTARNAPWDGGFSWKEDSNGNPFIATSNQGIGASIWWPNKDHAYDEPDNGLDLRITAPANLVAVGNGRLLDTIAQKNEKTWHWRVVNPINNYGVNINIGDYVRFSETYNGLKGELDLDYWVLRENLSKAKEQFKQVPKMLEAFEHWFGPYPFYEDSFKLVEVPYLGMEHQSSVTYGNKYQNGYLGNDLSGTGWGLKFDFIIIHEAGHEWFANNITHIDVADMWIHEGFTAYSENLYLDYHFGKEASSAYVIGTRRAVQNDRPIIGTYGVQQEGSSDMYYKGANILHTLRQLVEDDGKWREILRGLNETFYHQTVTSKQVEEYISEVSGIDLTEFWEQYLRTVEIPKIEYKISEKTVAYRYVNIVENFDMPVIAIVNDSEQWIYPTSQWKSITAVAPISNFTIKDDFYVESEKVEIP